MIFQGQLPCQALYASGKKKGAPCQNRAYRQMGDNYVCRLHGKTGEELPIDPNAEKRKQDETERLEKSWQEAASENKRNHRSGELRVGKILPRKAIHHQEGFRSVFPNFYHRNRSDGWGIPELSPMSLGPVNHHYPNLPPAENLENFYQGAKVYEGENLPEGRETSPRARRERGHLYQAKDPYRHKEKFSSLQHLKGKKVLYASHFDPKGNEHFFDYVEGRYFYCYWYERLVKDLPQLEELRQALRDGENLLILGYDGNEITHLNDMYLNPSQPFGHELVLASLLTLEEKEYPWRRYYHQHSKLYRDILPLN